MAIGKSSNEGGGFKTQKKYSPGYGLMIELDSELPRKFDSKALGEGDEKGLTLTGKVMRVFGSSVDGWVPAINDSVSLNVRSGDTRKEIFDDLSKTNEGRYFLLEGVTGNINSLEARWAHGAGANRDIRAVEIVGVPHVTFENPVAADGPKSGFLRLNLDGSATIYSVRLDGGDWVERELSFDTVVDRLKSAFSQDMNFRVSQRVLEPSGSVEIDGQDSLEKQLTSFRAQGYTSCVVRTFIPGTTDPKQVDVQVLSWPEDIPASSTSEGRVYEMPLLRETPRFAALRDGDAVATMEIIPGYEVNLVGNPSDATKSIKHAFVQNIIGKGLSDSQKALYGTQSYGPGITIRAVNDDGQILGLTRLATRTEGLQYRNLMSIPSAVFQDADKIDFTVKDKVAEEVVDS